MFQKPLTSEEEQLYLQKYREGDPQAGNVLIERNLRLVAHMAKKYLTPERELEDLLSIGTIGLIKAIRTFDAKKSCRLATYAAKCIDNELLMMIRSEKRRLREVSIYDPIGTDKEGNEINLIDILGEDSPPPIDALCLNENIEVLKKNLPGVLNDREYTIIVRRYGLDGFQSRTQRELAAELNISRSYVSRIEKKALEKLRSLFV